MSIEAHITSWFPVLLIVKNDAPVSPEELCLITVEAAEIFEKKYGIAEAFHHEALTALVEALAKTLELIKVAPTERVDSNFQSWERRSSKKIRAGYRSHREEPLLFTKDTVDLMAHEVAALFQKRGIEGFKAARVLSELEHRLADSYFDFLEIKIGGEPAKEFARSMQIAVETLERVKTLSTLLKNGNHKST